MPTAIDILNLPSGAQWFKADLHIHTPASTDFKHGEDTVTPQDVVDAALQKELDIIGITDHNTAGWCDHVRRAAEGSSLVVFPGVEISTPQGHVLALFDSKVHSSHIEDLLVKIGISRDKFGCLDVVSDEGIEGVFARIREFGGVAIAAHADRDNGFLNTIPTGAERKRVYLSQDLWAMEILDITSRNDHQYETRNYSRRMTCIQSSDSHSLDKIANRSSFFKMDDRSISGLKLALIDPDIRVRLLKDGLQSPEFVILGMWVTKGFLDRQTIRFNENVNCFIGDTGSGKSTAMELIRFGLDQQPIVSKILQEVENMLEQQLGHLGRVHILLAKGDTHYLVERTMGTPLPLPLVQRVTEHGLQPSNNLDMRSFFPIKGFSQSEIIEFSRDPNVRLSLTDDLIDCSTEFASINDLKANLRENAAAIIATQQKANNIHAELAKRAALEEEVVRIDSILDHSQIVKQQQWYTEQEILNHARKQIDELSDRLNKAIDQLVLPPPWPDGMGKLPNQDLLRIAEKAYQDWQDHIASMKAEASSRFLVVDESLTSLRREWDVRFRRAEAAYRQLLVELDEDGVGLTALSELRKGIQRQLSALDSMDQELQGDIAPRLCRLAGEREKLLSKLQENRKSISQKRIKKAKELSTKLEHKVVLKVHSRGDTSGLAQELRAIAKGSRLQGSDLARLAAKCHPVPFVKQLIAGDFDSLSVQSGLSSLKLSKIWDTIDEHNRLEDLYELQLQDIEDLIDVKLQIGEGNYRRLEDLSHGQKCMVVLMVALAEGDSPLLVDQPEDALHAPGIEEGIVSTLRSGRGGRQCIFATRNANILVSADAEQIIALKADAQNSQVTGTGSLDRFDQRQLIIYHVEGGEEAFQRRRTMYTLEPSV